MTKLKSWSWHQACQATAKVAMNRAASADITKDDKPIETGAEKVSSHSQHNHQAIGQPMAMAMKTGFSNRRSIRLWRSYGNIYTRASEVDQISFDTSASGLLPTTDAATIAAFGSNRLPVEMFATAYSTFRQDFNTIANNALRLAGNLKDLLGWKTTQRLRQSLPF